MTVSNGGEILTKPETNELIMVAAKTLFTYCRSRTNSKEDAEDLSQDILFQLLKAKGTFINEKAFYGFMWAVAGNVYKDWCKKRAKVFTAELSDNITDDSMSVIDLIEKESNLQLLHRELSLLTKQCRNVIIFYYFDGYKVSDISKFMNISESMVKFLLFKSRQILKEGMSMERIRGDLSYNPGGLDINFYGGEHFNPSNAKWDYDNNLIAQNILLACYNDSCTVEEISLQMGVAVPYLEKDLDMLCRNNLLTKKGKRFETDIVIFSNAFRAEAYEKTRPFQCEIAEIVDKFLMEHFDDIKSIGFYKGVDDYNLLKWHIVTIIFNEAVLKKYHNSLNPVYPTKYLGIEAFIIATESNHNNHDYDKGVSILTPCNSNDDYMFYMDVQVNELNPSGHYFVLSPKRIDLMLDIIKGKTEDFDEDEKYEIAEFIKRGLVRKVGNELLPQFPIFTTKQYDDLLALIDSTTTAIACKTQEMIKLTTDILIEHSPTSMKKEAINMGWISMFVIGAIVAPMKNMLKNGALKQFAENTYSAVYVVTER